MTSSINILTGANSMDTKELAHILLARGETVILTYRRNSLQDLTEIRGLFNIELQNNPNSVLDFCFCDITDQNSVNEAIKFVLNKYGKIDKLFMLAAMSHVGQSFVQREYSIMANGQSYYYFLEAVKNHTPNTKVFGALTSELAGNVKSGEVFDESTPWYPKSPYSCGKALGGHWINLYRDSTDSNIFACYAMTFNHSSCAYRTTDFFVRKLTNSFARIALNKEKDVKFGFLDFWRDEGYSSFYAEMMLKMLENDKPEHYVIATGETHHAEEYLDIAASYFNLNWKNIIKIDEKLKRPNEVVRLVGNSSKIQRDLGFRPNRMPFKDHIQLMCKYDYELESGQKPIRPNVFELYP